ncbi:hypothetical protein E2C01_085169 [Portunus trituberculatus]|uniref:Uncharacterized protein n=1 Tax=Portunus trituberculatus TaxID=210409 RepID=A0A5B7J5Z1_PORTR|nr:hypothetical protein [Portunus trituberculatus]
MEDSKVQGYLTKMVNEEPELVGNIHVFKNIDFWKRKENQNVLHSGKGEGGKEERYEVRGGGGGGWEEEEKVVEEEETM